MLIELCRYSMLRLAVAVLEIPLRTSSRAKSRSEVVRLSGRQLASSYATLKYKWSPNKRYLPSILSPAPKSKHIQLVSPSINMVDGGTIIIALE
jgi:hypothetical protein